MATTRREQLLPRVVAKWLSGIRQKEVLQATDKWNSRDMTAETGFRERGIMIKKSQKFDRFVGQFKIYPHFYSIIDSSLR